MHPRLAFLALGAVIVAAAFAWAKAPEGTSDLVRPEPAPVAGAAGTVRLRITATGRSLDVRLVGLDPRSHYAVRFDQGDHPVLGSMRTDRKGRTRLRFRGHRLPEGITEPIANRPIEVVTFTDAVPGAQVLTGRIPIVAPFPYWDDTAAGGGGNGGGGGSTTTRLAGVDGDGPFAVTSATFSLPTATGGLAPGSTVVWYPGAGSAVAAGGPYPPVVLVHAFQLGSGDYQDWAAKIASWGFVVAVPGHADPFLLPDNEKEVKTTLGAMDWLVAQDADQTSRFFGQLDAQKFGFVGHSLGGGAAIVAATRSATLGRVKAVVGLAPAPLSVQTSIFTTPTPILPDTASGFRPATLVVTGSQDLIVAASNSRSIYFDGAAAPRAFVRLDRHCHMNYADNIPALAAIASDYNASTCTTQASQLQEARIYVIPWLMFHLRGDTRVTDYVDGKYAAEQSNAAERVFE